MEYFEFEEDVVTLCVRASSFPDGVQAAHQKLHHELFPPAPGHTYYGISWPGANREIIYLAGVSGIFLDDPESIGCEPFIIRKGTYLCIEIRDFMKNIPQIGQTFQEMLADSRIDPNGYCLEMYVTNDVVRCLVPLVN